MLLPEATLLGNFPVMRTSDPEFARDRLFNVFGASRFDVARRADGFAVTANFLKMTDLGLAYVDFNGVSSVGFPAADFVRQIFNVTGAARLVAGASSEEIAPGRWSAVIPVGADVNLNPDPNYRVLVLRIEHCALLRYLSALLGKEVGRELEFAESVQSNPAMHALRLRVFQFASDYNSRGTYFSSLANAEVERMVIMKFLMCHRHNYSELLLREPIPSASSSIRLAEEYIEANWDQPIDIATLARVTNVSARSLFRQFRKERGCSPSDFAKTVRLRKALIMLENPTESTSVTQVALKCGFQNSGHFAHDYRLAFGELPSETLVRSRKRL
jgi:AraC-like DNA-binding protein